MDTQLKVNETDNETLGTEAPVRESRPAPPQKRFTRAKLLRMLPILLAIALIGYFHFQWRYAEDFPGENFAWKAHWIASPYTGNRIACFRKAFFVPDKVTHAEMFFAANDMYILSVNGSASKAGGNGEKWSTLPKLQTPYSYMGYYRRDYSATTYNLTANLHRGLNVVTVMVLSMQDEPRIASQIEIQTGTQQEVLSDNSWIVSPREEIQNNIPWTMPRFQPIGWRNAIQESEPVQVPLDVDPSAVTTPVAGVLLSAPTTQKSPTVTFQKTIDCPSRSVDGWLRLATSSTYDIYINGLYFDSTSLTAQYTQSVMTHNTTGQSSGVYDAFESIQGTRSVGEYTSTMLAPQVDAMMLRNIFHAGKNTIRIVLHPSVMDPLPRMSMDGLVRMEDGRNIQLSAVNNWQVSTDSGETWLQPTISAYPAEKYAGIKSEAVHGRIAPGYVTYIHIVRNDVIMLLACLLAIVLGDFWVRRNPLAHMRWPLPSPLTLMSLVALPAAIWMTLSFIAQSIYRGSPQWWTFSSPAYAYWTLVSAGIVALISAATLAVHYAATNRRVSRREDASAAQADSTAVAADEASQAGFTSPVMRFIYRYGYAIAMAVLSVVVAAFSLYNLSAADLLPDEYTSLMASRGILMHGMPVYPMTGVIYSRSALFHYLLALSMIIAHSTTNMTADRCISGIWQIAVTIQVYFLGREMKGRGVGLVSAVVVGLSPFMIYYAREARFYAQFAYFSALFTYFLYKSIRNPESVKLRAYTCLAFIGTYASQEFAVTLLPAWILIIILSGQAREWLSWKTSRWLVLAIGLIGLEFVLYTKYCVTPLKEVDQETILLMSIHADDLDQIPSMLFSGNERSQLLSGLLYFLGFFAVLLRPLFRPKAADTPDQNQLVENRFVQWRWWNFLYVFVTIGITLTTLTTPHPANRYVIHMFPPFAVCSVCVLFTVAEWMSSTIKRISGVPLTGRFAQALFIGATVALTVLALRPDRVWHNIAYSRTLNRGTTLATNYVHDHIRPGDKTLFFATDLGTIVLNQCDYFWRPPANSVFVAYMPSGKIVERDSGAVMIDNVDKLRAAMATCNRLWVVVPQPTLAPGPSPNGQMSKFVLANFVVEDEEAGMEVMLWDKNRNYYDDNVPQSQDDLYFF